MQEPTSPLRIADFRFYWLSRVLATLATIGMVVIIGYQLYDVARGQYGYSITQAAFLLGLLGLAQFVPVAIFTPVAGLVADRFDRRTVAALAMGIDLTIALSLAVATQAGQTSLPLLFTLAAITHRFIAADGQELISYSLVTREALGAARATHPRMPLIVPQSMRDRWLDPNRPGDDDLADEALAASEDPGRAVTPIDAPSSSRSPRLF